MRGFTLLPVVLAMSLIASIAFLLNRDNGINASLIGARADREHARYAAEAGLQAVNYAVQANACGGGYPISSSPVADAGFGGAAYSAHASATSGSPLTLTATGTYKGASVTLVRAGVHAYQSGVRTWVTQPGPGTGKDASVDEDHPTDSYGGEDLLEIEDDKKQVLIAFDLAALPAGSRIVPWHHLLFGLQSGATIALYQDDDGERDFKVQLITQDWVEGSRLGTQPTAGNPGVTWRRWNGVSPNDWAQGHGNGYDPRTLGVVPYTSSSWVEFDITAAAQGWMSGVYPNYGVWLVPFSNTKGKKFNSSDTGAGSAWKRPKLTASYLLPCGASAPA